MAQMSLKVDPGPQMTVLAGPYISTTTFKLLCHFGLPSLCGGIQLPKPFILFKQIQYMSL